MRDRLTIIGFVATGMLILLIFLLSLLLEGSARDFLIEEGGLIESASAFGHFLCVAIILYKGGLSYLKQYHYVVLLIIFFMLRELDFHDKFTTMGIFKSSFFIRHTVPLMEKLVGAMIILLLLYLIFKMVHRHSREFLLGLKNYSVVSIGIFMAIVLIVVSKSLDGLCRKFNEFDVEIPNQICMHLTALEEILELGLPIILSLTVIAYFNQKDVQPIKFDLTALQKVSNQHLLK